MRDSVGFKYTEYIPVYHSYSNIVILPAPEPGSPITLYSMSDEWYLEQTKMQQDNIRPSRPDYTTSDTAEESTD